MYAWIWRRLPGSIPVKVVQSVLLVLLVLVVLITWVFPALEPHVPLDQVVVG
ncbi:hypothetical protein [Nocardioides campestrisoli]|uniref:hypothetical protein n=1 Tax=Nocardioides campestrisoli TaxID=2736757 RepID=UPI0015E78698|nr:hypothetical protein [Nocardioides campestrisoli]